MYIQPLDYKLWLRHVKGLTDDQIKERRKVYRNELDDSEYRQYLEEFYTSIDSEEEEA